MKTVSAKATFSARAREIVRKFGWRELFARAKRIAALTQGEVK